MQTVLGIEILVLAIGQDLEMKKEMIMFFIGYEAGRGPNVADVNVSNNVIIGSRAGHNNSGDGNVFSRKKCWKQYFRFE